MSKDSTDSLVTGYSTYGWGDRIVDEVSRVGVDLLLEFELLVRPSAPTTLNHEPLHGFVAVVRIRARHWDGAMDWGPPGAPSTVYYGEHASLVAGVKAARRACKRSLALREGPEDE